ncbi:helix-turn-helix domain-containing protein [Baekduia alba]|uniref:helix-turn-helix domain-containing protein n=1 Tax=Baekduia alba TaxID=2997333 RepID=UPI00233FB798|nr:helix-turn-helix domain-containing protein [Baekduia alba]
MLDADAPVPSFAVGEGYAAYRGPAIDVVAHRHAAFQVAIAVQGAVAIVDASGRCHRGAALAVAPMARHRILTGTDLLTFFVEPHCAFADRLRERCGDGITAAPELRGLTEAELRPVRPSRALDPRLVAAMDAVAAPGTSMPDVATQVGLSSQRLRTLARQQLGMPLLRWRAWVRLRVAAEALREGRSIADAAITGGFADQAHLTRWMREMMGLTPKLALPALRDQARRAT